MNGSVVRALMKTRLFDSHDILTSGLRKSDTGRSSWDR